MRKNYLCWTIQSRFFLLNFAHEKLETMENFIYSKRRNNFLFWKTFAREKTKKFPILVNDHEDKQKKKTF